MEVTTNEPIYRDGRHYDLANGSLISDMPVYLELAKKARGPVLEVACGTGRIAIPIAKAGVDITGLDISHSMLAHAKWKAEQEKVQIPWIESDCRNFRISRKFRLIFMAFNSMQHLPDHVSLEAFFLRVHEHLDEGGLFALDVFNPSVRILSRDSGIRYPAFEYEDPDGGGKVIVEETNVYDDALQISRIKWYYSIGAQKDVRIDDLNMRCFFPQELDALLRYHGFSIVSKFGDFSGKAFSSGDPKQIVLCRPTE